MSYVLPIVHGVGPSVYMEMPAIIVGGISGGAHAVKKGFDIIGVAVLAIASGLGGGLMRDVILSVGPPLAFVQSRYLIAIAVTVVISFFFATKVARIRFLFDFIDALSLGFFGIVGAERALTIGLPIPGALLVGVITSVGGSVARDILCNETPSILAPGALMASPAFVGVGVYVALDRFLHLPGLVVAFASIGVTAALRLLAVWRGWHAPMPFGSGSSILR